MIKRERTYNIAPSSRSKFLFHSSLGTSKISFELHLDPCIHDVDALCQHVADPSHQDGLLACHFNIMKRESFALKAKRKKIPTNKGQAHNLLNGTSRPLALYYFHAVLTQLKA